MVWVRVVGCTGDLSRVAIQLMAKGGRPQERGKKNHCQSEREFFIFFFNEDIVYQSVKKSGKRLESGNDYPSSFPSTISSVCCEKKFAASAHI